MKKNSWDPVWEDIHAERPWGKYPAEELVRFMSKNFSAQIQKKNKVRVMDLGCGAGAAMWYLAREGYSAVGIDGSKSAIKRAETRFKQERLKGEFRVGDFTALPDLKNSFDCVIDIASIQHNSLPNIRQIISEIFRVLRPGGKFFGMMIASDKSLKNWPGTIHYTTQSELRSLFLPFSEFVIEYVIHSKNSQLIKQKFWIITAVK